MKRPFLRLGMRAATRICLSRAIGRSALKPAGKLIAAGCLVLLTLLPMRILAADSASGPRDLRSIKENGTLRIAITHFDIPPFHIRKADGTFAGKDIEFATQLGNALNVRIAFVDEPPTFDGVIQEVAKGRADIGLSKLSQTYGRVEYVRFSEPYTKFRHALLYNRAAISALGNGRPEDALRTYSGKIGVIGRSAYVDFATADYPKATIVQFPSWNATIDALKTGKVDVVYRDEFEVRSVLIEQPAMHINFGAAVISDRTSFLTIAICDSCVKLEEFINYFIAQHPREYVLDDLLSLNYQK
jgi:polar amino acid transport system substrate-binding protein